MSVEPVELPRGALAFCRGTLAAALWAALVLRRPALVVAAALVLAVSAALGIRRASLVALYRVTVHRLLPAGTVVVDARAERFARALGAGLFSVCFVLLLLAPLVGRGMLLALALGKTAAAFGHCGGVRLYEILHSRGGGRARERRGDD